MCAVTDVALICVLRWEVLLLISVFLAIGEFLKEKFTCAGALAWTMIPDDSSKPDIIQMCPWFLDYAMKQKVQWQTEIGGGKIGAMISKLKLDKFATWVNYTPIDLFQLYEKVIVHEVRTQTISHVHYT